MRLFIGLSVPELYRDNARSMIDAVRATTPSKVSWTKPENLHLTLKFLGNVDPASLPTIIEALSGVRFPAFTMRTGGIHAFPEKGKPRVLWLGVKEGASECADLADLVNQALVPLGFKAEEHIFRSHITLGRVKRHGGDDLRAELRSRELPWPPFTADRFTLWHSDTLPEGPVYTPQAMFNLC